MAAEFRSVASKRRVYKLSWPKCTSGPEKNDANWFKFLDQILTNQFKNLQLPLVHVVQVGSQNTTNKVYFSQENLLQVHRKNPANYHPLPQHEINYWSPQSSFPSRNWCAQTASISQIEKSIRHKSSCSVYCTVEIISLIIARASCFNRYLWHLRSIFSYTFIIFYDYYDDIFFITTSRAIVSFISDRTFIFHSPVSTLGKANDEKICLTMLSA